MLIDDWSARQKPNGNGAADGAPALVYMKVPRGIRVASPHRHHSSLPRGRAVAPRPTRACCGRRLAPPNPLRRRSRTSAAVGHAAHCPDTLHAVVPYTRDVRCATHTSRAFRFEVIRLGSCF